MISSESLTYLAVSLMIVAGLRLQNHNSAPGGETALTGRLTQLAFARRGVPSGILPSCRRGPS